MISLISLAAIVNGALVQIIMGSRVLYGMGRQSLAPAWLATVHRQRQTPYIATIMIGVVVWILATGLDITTLAKITSFIILLVFLLVNLSLIRLLKSESKSSQSTIRAKRWVPWTASIMTLLFLGVQLYQLLEGVELATH